ncbi:MAG: NUDIX hydrolase [Planctomycetota bacterium]
MDPTCDIVGTRELHRGAKFSFEQVELRTSAGVTFTRDVVRHPGAVVVLPVLETARGTEIVYIQNYRPAVGETLVELVAGTLEPPEPPAECAGRELIEEAGYRAGRIEPLGDFLTTPGLTDERMYAFVARDLKKVDRAPEPGELMTVHSAPVSDLHAMIDSGALRDAKSMLTLLLARRAGVLA